MSSFEAEVRAFVALVEGGRSLEAIDRFYADDVELRENYAAPRVGKAREREREARNLAALAEPLRVAARAVTCDPGAGVSMVEWHIELTLRGQRPQKLEEVAVQRWRDGKIVSERFFYEKMIDA
jgi:ketosteroid isomerase-like protein